MNYYSFRQRLIETSVMQQRRDRDSYMNDSIEFTRTEWKSSLTHDEAVNNLDLFSKIPTYENFGSLNDQKRMGALCAIEIREKYHVVNTFRS